jgi:hypothetical protein
MSQHTAKNIAAGGASFGDHSLGGWGKQEGLHPTVAGTADALRCLELCLLGGAPADVAKLKADEAKAAAAFLARELNDTIKASRDRRRKPQANTVRDVAAGVRGLSLETTPYLPAAKKARQAGVRWLIDARGKDGWSMYPGAEAMLFPTYHAVWALEQFRERRLPLERRESSEELEDEVTHSAAEGRAYLRDLAIEVDDGDGGTVVAWNQTRECPEPSPAATALAVLSLSHGDKADRELAELGARWLVNNQARWCRSDGQAYEPILPSQNGTFPNVSLCALACARSGAFPSRADSHLAIGEAIYLIERFWVPNLGGFAFESRRPYVGTTRAILSLDRVVRRKGASWNRLAALAHRNRNRAFREKVGGVQASVEADLLMVIDKAEDLKIEEPISATIAVAFRQLAQGGGISTLEAIAEEANVKRGSVATAIERLNDDLRANPTLSGRLDLLTDRDFIFVARKKNDRTQIFLRCELTVSE